MIYGAIWRDNEAFECKRNGFYIYVSVPLISVAGKYGGDNPVEYLVRFRTICDTCVSFSCGVGGAELLLKSSVILHIQTLTLKFRC
jgi:hypothetical protein